MLTAPQERGRIGRASARRHSGLGRPGRRDVASGDPHRADCIPRTADPVGAGFVDSLARPGGNATGFPDRIRLRRQMARAAQGDRYPA